MPEALVEVLVRDEWEDEVEVLARVAADAAADAALDAVLEEEACPVLVVRPVHVAGAGRWAGAGAFLGVVTGHGWRIVVARDRRSYYLSEMVEIMKE